MDTSTRVVVRHPWSGRLFRTVLLGAFAVPLDTVVVESLLHLDPGYAFSGKPPGPLGLTLIWVLIILPFALMTTWAALFNLQFKETFTPTGIEIRKVLRTRRLQSTDISEVRLISGSVHTGMGVQRFPRVQIMGRGREDPWHPILDGGMTNVAQALEMLDGYVRLRPEIVQDPDLRQIFEERGVLAPAQG